LLSHSDGLLLSNKGLHARGIHSEIPFLFERDHDLIKAACPAGINYLAASFVRTADDVREVKKLISEKNIYFIAKVETAAAVKNLSSILDEIEAILIDRGDLSTEIDILKLAMVQEKIIAEGLRRKKHIYLATQFLKNMETNPIPLISEVIDLCKTVSSGIRGIQLSEETAVGRYPVECVKLVFDALAANK
jgi:pyruvate kinase